MKYDVVIVGGGLAGLTSAAYLSSNGKKVALLEKGVLGGRAVSVDIKGFHFNFGAHAVYARDRSILSVLQKELNLQIDWKDFSPDHAFYDLGDSLEPVPSDAFRLLKSGLLDSPGKISFVWQAAKTVLNVEKGDRNLSIGEWMKKKQMRSDVRELLMSLASSNFFAKDPEKIPSETFFSYYRKMFLTNKPVSYIAGGWGSLVGEFERVIRQNGGEIFTKTKVENAFFENGVLASVKSGENAFEADHFIFCMPPSELVNVFKETDIAESLNPYASQDPAYALVFDVGLKKRIPSDCTYIYDKHNRMFLTDISYYDPSSAPEGGQLLQMITYASKEDLKNKDTLDAYKEKMEKLLDKHFPGWKEEVAAKRASNRAIVQTIKSEQGQKLMPTHFKQVPNLFFAGDWCEGQGQLSELSFSSAYAACKDLLIKTKKDL